MDLSSEFSTTISQCHSVYLSLYHYASRTPPVWCLRDFKLKMHTTQQAFGCSSFSNLPIDWVTLWIHTYIHTYTHIYICVYIYIYFFFCFLRPHPWHMEVPRPGVQLELYLPAYTTATATSDLSHICDIHHSSWQSWIHNPLSEARDGTPNLMVPSRICFRCTTIRTPRSIYLWIHKFQPW